MGSFKFSNRSCSKLATCHVDLQIIAEEALVRTCVDFLITEGHRSVERQKQLFDEGKSRIDGITKKGKHNYSPSLAFDIAAYVSGKVSWDVRTLCYLGGVVRAVSERLFADRRISHTVRWGGNWDGDGEIIKDQNFMDLPHFELQSAR